MSRFLRHIVLLILLYPLSSQAQQVDLQVTQSEVLLADTLGLWVSAKMPPNVTVNWPVWKGEIGGFTIHSAGNPANSESASSQDFIQRLTIQAFDTGKTVVGPVSVEYVLDGIDSVYSVTSDSVIVYVGLREAVDSNKVYDIYKPLSVKYTFKEMLQEPSWRILIYSLSGIILIGIIFLIWYLLKRRKEKVDLGPQLPAHEIAFRKLQKLEQEKIWQKDSVKEYYSQLTQIVREYLENRYGIQALEETTDEILDMLQQVEMTQEVRDLMRDLLNLSDLVKFAKEEPELHELTKSLNEARDFVKETREQEEETEEIEGGEDA